MKAASCLWIFWLPKVQSMQAKTPPCKETHPWSNHSYLTVNKLSLKIYWFCLTVNNLSLTVDSWQLICDSAQFSVTMWQLTGEVTVDNWQLTVEVTFDNNQLTDEVTVENWQKWTCRSPRRQWQLAVDCCIDSGHLTVDSWQLTVDCWQLTVDIWQLTVKGHVASRN